MKFSRPEFFANLTLSSQVLRCKHYMFMYLNEKLTKFWLAAKNGGLKNTHPLNPKFLELRGNIFHMHIFSFLLGALNVM